MESPLRCLVGPLTVFRCLGGFPLKEVREDAMEWELHGLSWRISWVISVVVMLYFIITYSALAAILPVSWKILAAKYLENGLTLTELFFLMAYFGINSYLVVLYLKSLKNIKADFSTMCQKMGELNQRLGINRSQIEAFGNSNFRHIIFLYMKHILAVGLDAYVNFMVLPDMATEYKGLAISSFFLAFLILGWPILSCSYQMITSQILDVLDLQLIRFEEKLEQPKRPLSAAGKEKRQQNPAWSVVEEKNSKSESSCSPRQPSSVASSSCVTTSSDVSTAPNARKGSSSAAACCIKPNPSTPAHKDIPCLSFLTVTASSGGGITLSYSEVCNLAANLYDTTSLVNLTLGPFLYPTIGTCLLYQVTGIFGSLHLIDAFSYDDINWTAFLFSATNLLIALHGYMRASIFFGAGQRITAGFSRVNRHLEDYFLEKQADLSEEEKTKLKFLIDRYRKDAPVKPEQSFGLTASTRLTSTGIILTYIIILVQYKLGKT